MVDPQSHILKLQKRKDNTDPSFLRALAGAINRLEKSFPEQWHFLMEFLQNADDCQSTSLTLELNEDSILVVNDGKPFDYEDVESICNVGHSSKTHPDKGEDYIGYLGVGFKSVFLISDQPQIHSGEYRFEFNKHAWDNPDEIPWQITPNWIEDDVHPIPSGKNTSFQIPLSEDISSETFEKLRAEVSTEHINDRTILFLKNIQEIEIIDNIHDTRRRVRKSQLEGGENYEIYEIGLDTGQGEDVNRWLVFDTIIEIPDYVKDDSLTQRWERDGLETREVQVAFRIDDNHELQQQAGTAHMGVFSFLPLKEVPSGLNFLVQGDFLTAPGRDTIHREASWNKWLAQEIYDLIETEVIPTFKQHQIWRRNFTKILYPERGGHTLFDTEIHEPLQEYLLTSEVILNTENEFSKPNQIVKLHPDFAHLISESDFETLFPGYSRIHQDCETVLALKQQMVDGPNISSSKGISENMQALLEIKADQQDTEFFQELYRFIGEWADSTLAGTRVQRDPIVLTSDFEIKSPREAYTPEDEKIITEHDVDDFDLVHPELQQGNESRVLEKLGTKNLTKNRIEQALNKEESIFSINQWSGLDDDPRITKTGECLDHLTKGNIHASDLDGIEILAKSGEWVAPEEIVLSVEYEPEHRIEDIYNNGLITSPLLFISPRYLGYNNDPSSWRRFFKQIGVEKDLNEKSIVDEVAVESALRIERNHGRDARSLPRHEETGGYDIKSNDRLIEVKGSKAATPQITLTTKQFSRLKEEQGRYYVYIIRNALQRPRLSIVEANDILNVDRKIQVSFSEVQDLATSEHEVLE